MWRFNSVSIIITIVAGTNFCTLRLHTKSYRFTSVSAIREVYVDGKSTDSDEKLNHKDIK